jgi:uncharacterized protein involved in outer membrane biogenesis
MEKALARKVKAGQMRLTLLPPALWVGDLEVAEDAAFGKLAFASAKELRVRVRLMPLLLQQKMEIASLDAAEPAVRLIRNRKGAWNFSTLGGQTNLSGAKAAAGAMATAPALEIGELNIVNGTVTIVDERPGKRPTVLENVNLSLSGFAPGRPFDYKLGMSAGKGSLETEGRAGPYSPGPPPSLPIQGQAKLQNIDLQAVAAALDMPGLAGTATGDASFSVEGETMPVEGSIQVERLRLHPQGSPAQAPVNARFKLNYAPKKERLEASNVELRSGGSLWNLTGRVSTANPAASEIQLKTVKAQLTDVARILPALAIKTPAGSALAAGLLSTSTTLRGPFDTLNGGSNLNIESARLAGYSFGKELAVVAKLLNIPTGPDTVIDKATGDLRFQHGAISSDNLHIVMPGMIVTGAGTIGAQRELNLRMTAQVTSQTSAGGLFQKVTGGSNTVAFFLRGTMERPMIVPDVAGMARQQIEQRKDTIKGILGGFFGKKK